MSDAPRRPVIAKAETVPATGTSTVAVALKLPQGLIIHYQEERTSNESTPTGFRSVKAYFPTGEPFVLRGNAANAEMERFGLIPDQGGYAITGGMPKDLWEQWFSANVESALVVNDLIRAFPDEAAALVWARLKGSLRSGLERIDPERPELTTGRPVIRGVSTVQPGSRT
jgi:hypothetical protein